MKERLHHIDGLKGFAMILVVIGHIIVFCGLGHDNIFIKNIVMINMPLFLFLNGLVVKSLPIVDGYKYLIKKFRQIFIPFLSWGVLITLYRHESYVNFLFHYWKFGYWYLLVLFEFYIIYWVIGLVTSFINRWITDTLLRSYCIVVAFIVGYFCIRFGVRLFPDRVMSLTSYFQILEYYPYFFLGVVIKQFNLQNYLKQNNSAVMTFLLILTPVAYCIWCEIDNTLTLLILRILSIMMLFMIAQIYFNREAGHINKIFNTIGKHTLAIYMIQFYLFSSLNFHNLYELLDRSGNGLVILVLSFISSILLCYICILGERLIQTSPFLSSIFLGKPQIKSHASISN